jgi:hypothetical protein
MDIHGISYTDSAARMRVLLKTGLLRHTDLGSNPERFFLAHRLLALHAPQLGPGFWIRFTVHYNLMAGSVLGLGSPEQVHPSTRFLTIPSSTTPITHHTSLLIPSLQLDTLNDPRLFPTQPSNPQTNRLQTPKSLQVALLDQMQDNGDLGCFSLTEKLAGVSSGLVVNTTATWDAASQTFTLNSPDVGSYKNWISQVRFRSFP